MLYTPVPAELIFQEVAWSTGKEKKLINYQGVNIEVDVLDSGEFKVERLISTDPQDYLNPSLQPGLKIKFF